MAQRGASTSAGRRGRTARVAGSSGGTTGSADTGWLERGAAPQRAKTLAAQGSPAPPTQPLPRAAQAADKDTVRKVSVSLPDSVTRPIKEMVGPGQFSAYVAAALQRQIALDLLAAYVADVEEELGRPISDALMVEAETAWHAG